MNMSNIDPEVVRDFGEEWSAFNQTDAPLSELECLFQRYFEPFPWDALPPNARGFDCGCGSGRWAALVAPRVDELHCIDPSPAALDVARRRLAGLSGTRFHQASVDSMPLEDGSMDFGYSLGVLHHVPDTEAGVRSCAAKLKPGAPMLIYLYYAFDNKPAWYRAVWKVSDMLRKRISKLGRGPKHAISEVIAATVYFPLARGSLILQRLGINVANLPLSDYRDKSFYTMRTDALDRFGTRLEQRFTRHEIESMMNRVGLTNVRFAQGPPYWCAVGFKSFS